MTPANQIRNEPFKPGWLVRGDKLSIYMEEQALTVRAWPHLTAWRCDLGGAWHGTRPAWPFLGQIDEVLEWDPPGAASPGAAWAAWFSGPGARTGAWATLRPRFLALTQTLPACPGRVRRIGS